ncbi:MAG: ABC transporter permease [Deltaproteobacteria bacterium]|nr:ABC transporter permease [Deltaproteobacteria bacterium]
MKVIAIAINTFKEAIRNKILYSVILFAGILIAVSALFGSVTIGSQVNVIKDFGLFALSFFGTIITIICGVSLLSRELKQRTIYNILSKPVERWQFIAGKHLGLSLTVASLVSIMGLGLIAFVGFFEHRVELLLFEGVFLIILEVIVVASVSIFFSALVVTTTLSGLFTLAFYIAGRSISYFKYFLEEGENHNATLALIVRIFDLILPDLSLFNFNDAIVYREPVAYGDLLYAVAYCMAYSLAALSLAVLLFNRRELN